MVDSSYEVMRQSGLSCLLKCPAGYGSRSSGARTTARLRRVDFLVTDDLRAAERFAQPAREEPGHNMIHPMDQTLAPVTRQALQAVEDAQRLHISLPEELLPKLTE